MKALGSPGGGKGAISSRAPSARLLAMAPEERSEIVQILENSRREFNAAAGGVAESQASVRPEAGRWSVLPRQGPG